VHSREGVFQRARTDLQPANNEAIELELTGEGRAKHRYMAEAVVSASSPFLGLTVREANFRETYSAAIIAIYRAGGRVTTRVGDIVLRAGDNLLLECSQAFVATHRTSTDFQLVSMLEDSSRVPRQPVYVMVITVVLLIIMVVIAAIASLNTGYFIMALAVCFCMWWLGTLTVNEARVAINLPVMVMIAGSIGFSTAISNAGLDRAIALNLITLFQPLGELGILFSIYISVAVLNAVISNKVGHVSVRVYSLTHTFIGVGIIDLSDCMGCRTAYASDHPAHCHLHADDGWLSRFCYTHWLSNQSHGVWVSEVE
jgi:di/tricarboxylate transporter